MRRYRAQPLVHNTQRPGQAGMQPVGDLAHLLGVGAAVGARAQLVEDRTERAHDLDAGEDAVTTAVGKLASKHLEGAPAVRGAVSIDVRVRIPPILAPTAPFRGRPDSAL